jgi:hypothetical protein
MTLALVKRWKRLLGALLAALIGLSVSSVCHAREAVSVNRDGFVVPLGELRSLLVDSISSEALSELPQFLRHQNRLIPNWTPHKSAKLPFVVSTSRTNFQAHLVRGSSARLVCVTRGMVGSSFIGLDPTLLELARMVSWGDQAPSASLLQRWRC